MFLNAAEAGDEEKNSGVTVVRIANFRLIAFLVKLFIAVHLDDIWSDDIYYGNLFSGAGIHQFS